MNPHEPSVDDPVDVLRAVVEWLLIPAVRHCDRWDTDLHEVLADPTCPPLLRQHLVELRATVQRCRELGEEMVALISAGDSRSAIDRRTGDGPDDSPASEVT
jgi:hypothetical protein